MTATERATDRSIPLLLAAAGMVVAVVAAVLVFGVERPPSVESITTEPVFTPPGAIAWTAWTGSETCLFVADPQGEVREVVCDDLLGADVIGWSADGILVRDYTRPEGAIAVIDPDTGDRSTRAAGPRPDPDGQEADGSGMRIRTEREDGTLRVFVGDDPDDLGDLDDLDDLGDLVLVWEVVAPTSYDVVQVAAAPGGRVVAMTDTAGRLLVAPADGSSEPRLWTDEVDRYTQVTWEGTDPDR
jgi:hypothetical protein